MNVYQVTSHCIFPCEDSTADWTDCVSSMNTTMMSKRITSRVVFSTNIANPSPILATTWFHLVWFPCWIINDGVGGFQMIGRWCFGKCFCAHNPKCFPYTQLLNLFIFIFKFFFFLILFFKFFFSQAQHYLWLLINSRQIVTLFINFYNNVMCYYIHPLLSVSLRTITK